MMIIYVFLFTNFVLNVISVPVNDLSHDKLEELEGLIKQLRDIETKTTDLAPTPQRSDPVSSEKYLKPEGVECGVNKRLEYKQCIAFAENVDSKKKCANDFSDGYTLCYFGSSLTTGFKDPLECEDNCLHNSDKCIYNSNEVETFICINGRETCRNNCPMEQKVISKRGCFQDCSGHFRMCEQQCKDPSAIFICARNESVCRKKCKK